MVLAYDSRAMRSRKCAHIKLLGVPYATEIRFELFFAGTGFGDELFDHSFVSSCNW